VREHCEEGRLGGLGGRGLDSRASTWKVRATRQVSHQSCRTVFGRHTGDNDLSSSFGRPRGSEAPCALREATAGHECQLAMFMYPDAGSKIMELNLWIRTRRSRLNFGLNAGIEILGRVLTQVETRKSVFRTYLRRFDFQADFCSCHRVEKKSSRGSSRGSSNGSCISNRKEFRLTFFLSSRTWREGIRSSWRAKAHPT
jgi:hypothetical protein